MYLKIERVQGSLNNFSKKQHIANSVPEFKFKAGIIQTSKCRVHHKFLSCVELEKRHIESKGVSFTKENEKDMKTSWSRYKTVVFHILFLSPNIGPKVDMGLLSGVL